MNVAMFIVGFVIFAAYMALTVWSIFYNSKKQREENYPYLDGMGNYSKDYYARHNVRFKKQSKQKQGSQSRKKSYKIEKIVKK